MGVGGMLACFRNKLPLVGGVVKLHLKEAGGGREWGGAIWCKIIKFQLATPPPMYSSVYIKCRFQTHFSQLGCN